MLVVSVFVSVVLLLKKYINQYITCKGSFVDPLSGQQRHHFGEVPPGYLQDAKPQEDQVHLICQSVITPPSHGSQSSMT